MRRVSLFIFIALFAVPLGFAAYLGAGETMEYLRRSPERAEKAAYRLFLRDCADFEMDPKSFTGPRRADREFDRKRGSYTFLWSQTPDKTIYVTVSYFPYDLVDTMSVALIEQQDRLRRERSRATNQR